MSTQNEQQDLLINTNSTLATLLNLYESRKAKNRSYSVRALARDLKIDQAQLTRILNNKAKATPLVAYKLATHLELPKEMTLDLLVSTIDCH